MPKLKKQNKKQTKIRYENQQSYTRYVYLLINRGKFSLMIREAGTYSRKPMCLFLRRKGSHYSPVVYCSSLLLPLCSFPTRFFIHSGFWVGRSMSVVHPRGCPFPFTFSLFPLLSFLSPHTTLCLSTPSCDLDTHSHTVLKSCKTHREKKRLPDGHTNKHTPGYILTYGIR